MNYYNDDCPMTKEQEAEVDEIGWEAYDLKKASFQMFLIFLLGIAAFWFCVSRGALLPAIGVILVQGFCLNRSIVYDMRGTHRYNEAELLHQQYHETQKARKS